MLCIRIWLDSFILSWAFWLGLGLPNRAGSSIVYPQNPFIPQKNTFELKDSVSKIPIGIQLLVGTNIVSTVPCKFLKSLRFDVLDNS